MLSRILPKGRSRLIVLCYPQQHSQNSTCLSTFSKRRHSVGEGVLFRRLPNQQKAQQHQNTFPELLAASVSCQQQRACSHGRTDEHHSRCSEDAPLPPSKRDSSKLSALKAGRKQKSGGHGDAIKGSAQCHSGSGQLIASDRQTCSNDNANTFECSQDTEDHFHNGIVKDCESSAGLGVFSELSMIDWGVEVSSSDCSVLSGFSACETSTCDSTLRSKDDCVCASASNNLLRLADLRLSLQPSIRAVDSTEEEHEFEFVRKVELAEQLSPNGASILVKNSAFGGCSFEQLEAVIKVLKSCLVANDRVFKVLAKNPSVLLHPVDSLHQKLQLFAFFQIEKETLYKLFTSARVLNMSVKALQEKFALLDEIGLNDEALNKTLCKGPWTLTTSKEKLMKAVNFFRSNGVTRETVTLLIKSQPSLFGLSFDDNLMPRYNYLQQIGISAQKIPIIMAYSSRTTLDGMKENTQRLKDLGFSDADVCVILQRQPSLVARSSKTLKKKVDFLVHEMEWNMADIVKFPSCLSLSLERRIIPRCRIAKEHCPAKVYSLGTLLGYSDAKFKKLLWK